VLVSAAAWWLVDRPFSGLAGYRRARRTAFGKLAPPSGHRLHDQDRRAAARGGAGRANRRGAMTFVFAARASRASPALARGIRVDTRAEAGITVEHSPCSGLPSRKQARTAAARARRGAGRGRELPPNSRGSSRTPTASPRGCGPRWRRIQRARRIHVAADGGRSQVREALG